MNRFLITIAILMPLTAQAGGLSDPVVEPPVYIDPVPQWGGVTVGLFAGKLSYSETVTTSTQTFAEKVTTEVRETLCEAKGNQDPVWERTCVIDYDTAVESGATELTAVRSWKDCEDAHCIWGVDAKTGAHMIYGQETLWTIARKVVETGTILIPNGRETSTETIDVSERTFGGFANYRIQAGDIVLGAEVLGNGDLMHIDAHAGYSLGRALPYVTAGYASFNDMSGAAFGAGVDFQLSGNVTVGLEAMRADEFDAAFVKVGWKF